MKRTTLLKSWFAKCAAAVFLLSTAVSPKIHAAYTNFYWTGSSNNGLWNTTGNWLYGGNPTGSTPQSQRKDHEDVVFGLGVVGTDGPVPLTQSIKLTSAVTLWTGIPAFTVKDGSFAFDLNTYTLTVGELKSGDPTGRSGVFSFTSSSGTAAVKATVLTLWGDGGVTTSGSSFSLAAAFASNVAYNTITTLNIYSAAGGQFQFDMAGKPLTLGTGSIVIGSGTGDTVVAAFRNSASATGTSALSFSNLTINNASGYGANYQLFGPGITVSTGAGTGAFTINSTGSQNISLDLAGQSMKFASISQGNAGVPQSKLGQVAFNNSNASQVSTLGFTSLYLYNVTPYGTNFPLFGANVAVNTPGTGIFETVTSGSQAVSFDLRGRSLAFATLFEQVTGGTNPGKVTFVNSNAGQPSTVTLTSFLFANTAAFGSTLDFNDLFGANVNFVQSGTGSFSIADHGPSNQAVDVQGHSFHFSSVTLGGTAGTLTFTNSNAAQPSTITYQSLSLGETQDFGPAFSFGDVFGANITAIQTGTGSFTITDNGGIDQTIDLKGQSVNFSNGLNYGGSGHSVGKITFVNSGDPVTFGFGKVNATYVDGSAGPVTLVDLVKGTLGVSGTNITLVQSGTTGSFVIAATSTNTVAVDLLGQSSTFGGGLTLGSGSGNTANVKFVNSGGTPASLTFGGNILIGDNGSAGNTLRTSQFFGPNVVGTFTGSNGNIVVGSENGGINDSFILDSGSMTRAYATINVGSTTAASNNSIVVDGAKLNITGSIYLNGYYDPTDPANIINSNNQIIVRNGGILTGTCDYNGYTINDGAGISVLTGGTFNMPGGGFFVTQAATLLVDGIGSTFNAGSVGAGSGGSAGGHLDGIATISNGGAINNNAGQMRLSGTLKIDGGSMNVISNLTNAQTGQGLIVTGDMELTNGATFVMQHGGSYYSGLYVSGTGNVSVANKSQLSVERLWLETTDSTAKLALTGTSTLNVTSALDVSLDYSRLTVSPDSTLNATGLYIPQGDQYLNVQGIVNWIGGVGPGSAVGKATLHIGPGTTLVSSNGVHTFGNDLKVDTGGRLAGGGTIQAYLRLNGGEISPGLPGDITGTPFVTDINVDGNNSVVALDIYSYNDYDTIGSLNFNSTGKKLTVKVNLAPGLDVANGDVRDGDTFQLIARGYPGSYVSDYYSTNFLTFDFSQSAPLLAAQGLAWDTTQFRSYGTLKIVTAAAVPPTPIQTWRQTWFGTTNGTGAAADDATPAGDGIPNIVKFATSSADPHQPITNPGVVTQLTSKGKLDNSWFYFTYPRNPNANGYVNCMVEWSDTLEPGSWSDAGATAVNAGDDFITVRFPKGGSPRRFARLRVSTE